MLTEKILELAELCMQLVDDYELPLPALLATVTTVISATTAAELSVEASVAHLLARRAVEARDSQGA